VLGLDVRTVQRWKRQGVGEDRRAGPKTAPGNSLTEAERRAVLRTVNSPEYRDLSVKQIVPLLADRGVYLASESTMYRILRTEQQLTHRAPSRVPQTRTRPDEAVATGPNQVWSWDITYLPSAVRGQFYYLYMAIDVFSRKIVGSAVHEREDGSCSAALIREACAREGVDRGALILHSDNGGPMKAATLLATLQVLGVVPSFSRPRVSNDNPFSEALFRTLKYRPEYPATPFASLEQARAWVAGFVGWYNDEHLHSAIRFVTPSQRHRGEDTEILARRERVYARARQENPHRWTTGTRDWSRNDVVRLNPNSLHATTEVA
jgi:putative transposase